MAHGHDLAFVPRAIIHSLCFAYDQYAQAIMRVHRIVSEKPVEVHVICGSRTLDDYLFDLLRRKDEAAKTVLDGTVIERSVGITPDEWQKLWRQVQEAAETIEVK
jgi:SNF2 family DNA or RNA helicase